MRKNTKEIIKGLAITLTIAAAYTASTRDVYGATAVYVGKDVCQEETALVAGSTDTLPGSSERVYVVDGNTYNEGTKITQSNGFEYILPEVTYKYQVTETMKSSQINTVASVATNEYGLAVSGMINYETNSDIKDADPLAKDGISEEAVVKILASSCRDAREAVVLLTDLVDEYGASSTGGIFVSDMNETWYVEIYSGYQYAAILMPDDKIAVFTCDFAIDSIDEESEEVLCSDDLISIAEDNEFAVYNKDGSFNPAMTFSDKEEAIVSRELEGLYRQLLVGEELPDENADTEYEMFIEPDESISVADVFAFYRDCLSSAKKENKVNSSDNTGSAYVIQMYEDVPRKMSSVMWVNLAWPEYSPFVPVSNIVNEIPASYSEDHTANEGFKDDVAAYSFERLSKTCSLNDLYGADVKEYWENVEKKLVRDYDSQIREDWSVLYVESSEDAAEIVTEYCSETMDTALSSASQLYDDFSWNLINSDSKGIKYYIEEDENGNKVVTEDDNGFVYYYDVEEYAINQGWDIQKDDDYLVAVRGDEVIVIDREEGKFYYSDESVVDETEEEVEVAADEPEKTPIKELKNKSKEVSASDTDAEEVEDSKLADKKNIEAEPLVEEDSIQEDATDEPIEVEEKVETEKYNASRTASVSVEGLGNGVSAEDIIDLLDAFNDETKAVISQLLGIDIVKAIEEFKKTGSISMDIRIDNSDISDEARGYVDTVMDNVSLLEGEYSLTEEDIKLLEKYVINLLAALNDETKAELSEMLHIDIDKAVEAYRKNGKIDIDIYIDAKDVDMSNVDLEEVLDQVDSISDNINVISENNSKKNTENKDNKKKAEKKEDSKKKDDNKLEAASNMDKVIQESASEEEAVENVVGDIPPVENSIADIDLADDVADDVVTNTMINDASIPMDSVEESAPVENTAVFEDTNNTNELSEDETMAIAADTTDSVEYEASIEAAAEADATENETSIEGADVITSADNETSIEVPEEETKVVEDSTEEYIEENAKEKIEENIEENIEEKGAEVISQEDLDEVSADGNVELDVNVRVIKGRYYIPTYLMKYFAVGNK